MCLRRNDLEVFAFFCKDFILPPSCAHHTTWFKRFKRIIFWYKKYYIRISIWTNVLKQEMKWYRKDTHMHAHTLIYEFIKSTAKIGNFYKDLKSNASYDITQRLYYWTKKKVKNLKSNIGFVKDFIHIIFQLVHHHIIETNTMSMHVLRSLEAAGFPLFFISGVLTLFPLSLLFFSGCRFAFSLVIPLTNFLWVDCCFYFSTRTFSVCSFYLYTNLCCWNLMFRRVFFVLFRRIFILLPTI